MTGLRHHLRDETLIGYASGTLDEAFAIVVSSHLQFCSRCRDRVRELEQVAAAMLEQLPGPETDIRFETRALARFHTEVQADASSRDDGLPYDSRADAGNEYLMPRPLARKTGLRRDTIPWLPVAIGLHSYRVPSDKSAAPSALHFLRLGANVAMPPEHHEGDHLVLVLWGGYETEGGVFERGDVHDIPASSVHAFAARKDGVVCIVATESGALSRHEWSR